MHATPPHAPPSLSQGAQQEAIDALDRLVATHRWAMDQETALPGPPAEPGDLDGYLRALAAFWRASVVPAPGADAEPRRTVFAQRLIGVMADDATLRHADGTLTGRATALVSSFTRSAPQPPDDIETSELLVGGVAYAGALLLTDRRMPGMALLFTPAAGWEEFADVPTLLRRTEGRLRADAAAGIEQEGMMPDDLEAGLDGPFVTSRVIAGPVMPALMQRLADLQEERVTALWEGMRAASGPEAADRYFSDRIIPALALRAALDVDALLAHRDSRLLLAIGQERIAEAPANVQRDWNDAWSAYAMALRVAERRRVGAGVKEPRGIDEVVHDTLVARLAAIGVTEDPDHITIAIRDFNLSYLLASTPGIAASRLGPVRETITLAQLAMRNAGTLDGDLLIASEAHGHPLPAAFFNGGIRRFVREADVATAYLAHLRDALFASPEAATARSASMDVRAARMRFEAENARLGYFLGDEPRSFADDRGFRGYAWVKAALDSPAARSRSKVEGHDVVVSHLAYDGERIRDVLVIGAKARASVSAVVLYTPDAPDGIAYREFSGRDAAMRALINDGALREYLLDRMPVDRVAMAANGSGRIFRQASADRTANWSLNGQATFGATMAAFGDVEVMADFLGSSYDLAASLLLKDVDAVARTTAHATADTFSPRIDGEGVARAIAGLLGRPFQAGWRAYDSIRAGDDAQAFVHFTDAYVASLDFAMLGMLRPGLPRALGVRVASGSRELLPVASSTRSAKTAFPERFVARDVSLRDATSVKDGIYTIGEGRYVEQGLHLYAVRRDGQTWRLVHPDSSTMAPFIRRTSRGNWDYLGLDGGFKGSPSQWVDIADSALTDALSFYQRLVFQESLIARTSMTEARLIARRTARNSTTGPYVRLTVEQEEHWLAALHQAQRAPLERPRPAARESFPPGAARAVGAQGLPVAAHARPLIGGPLPPEQWPDSVWYYPSTQAAFPVRDANGLLLTPSRLGRDGVQGIDVIGVGPRTPWATLSGMAGGPTLAPGVTLRVFEWVRIDLRAVRQRGAVTGQSPLTVHVMRQGSHVSHVLRPADGAGGPTLLLQRGEFDTGIAFVSQAEVQGEAAVAGPSRPAGGPPPP